VIISGESVNKQISSVSGVEGRFWLPLTYIRFVAVNSCERMSDKRGCGLVLTVKESFPSCIINISILPATVKVHRDVGISELFLLEVKIKSP